MAKLICVYRTNDLNGIKFGRRQLPLTLTAGENNLMMVIDLTNKGLVFDHSSVKGKELEEFTRKYTILTASELKKSLEVTSAEFQTILSQSVPCVGCRRSVERLFNQLTESGHPTLDPIQITSDGLLTVVDAKQQSPQVISTLLYRHNSLLNGLMETQHRNKKSSRCPLHSIDSFRTRPFIEMWKDVWNCMKQQCRDEIAHIHAHELQTTLDGYVKKHKFCQECRNKIEKAYALLINEKSPNKEKGYVAALYANIKKCVADKHIHLQTKADFIQSLIIRAEPEFNGSTFRPRERHAKTLEVAQEEVLTCIGMCIYDRLRRIHILLREEENACQVLGAVAVHAIGRSFDIAVENKRGISNLELLYQEIARAERRKELRKENKKMKKKKKKDEKRAAGGGAPDCCKDGSCDEITIEDDDVVGDTVPIRSQCNCDNGKEDSGDDAVDDDRCNYYYGLLANEQHSCCRANGNEDDSCVDNQSNCPTTGNNNKSKRLVKADLKDLRPKHEVMLEDTNKDSISIASSCNSCGHDPVSGQTFTKSIDAGYVSSELSSNNDGSCSFLSSDHNSRTSSLISTPDGSEVACSDECCNCQPNRINENDTNFTNTKNIRVIGCLSAAGDVCCMPLTLEQMLDEPHSEDENNFQNDTIPDEVLLDFKCREQNIKEMREKLRDNFKQKFAQMCNRSKATVKAIPTE